MVGERNSVLVMGQRAAKLDGIDFPVTVSIK
jgi:hypothetical protein